MTVVLSLGIYTQAAFHMGLSWAKWGQVGPQLGPSWECCLGTQYEEAKLANWNNRNLGVFNWKLEGSHCPFYLILEKMNCNIIRFFMYQSKSPKLSTCSRIFIHNLEIVKPTWWTIVAAPPPPPHPPPPAPLTPGEQNLAFWEIRAKILVWMFILLPPPPRWPTLEPPQCSLGDVKAEIRCIMGRM